MTSTTIEYSFLGNSGLKVSNICLGTATFGKLEDRSNIYFSWFYSNPRQLQEEAAHQVLDRFAELGGNFIDTANAYSFGKSEEIVGNWLTKRQNREKMIIATKGCVPMDGNANVFGNNRRNLIASCEGSLKRLQTDYIDLYQCHMWDNSTPIDETLRTLDDLVRCGKIRHYGFSNVMGWQMQKIVTTAKEYGFSRCISLQQQYNLLNRYSELEPFAVCQSEGVGVLPWSPLCGGWLTGKFKKGDTHSASESRIGLMLQEKPPKAVKTDYRDSEQYWNVIDILRSISTSREKTLAQVALRWLLQKDVVASVIVGVTSLAQLEDNIGASTGWKLTEEEMNQLDEASAMQLYYPYDVLSSDFMPGRYNRFNRDSY